jgi:hypothetical protein
VTFKPKGSDLEKSISKSRKGYLKVKFLGILMGPKIRTEIHARKMKAIPSGISFMGKYASITASKDERIYRFTQMEVFSVFIYEMTH